MVMSVGILWVRKKEGGNLFSFFFSSPFFLLLFFFSLSLSLSLSPPFPQTLLLSPLHFLFSKRKLWEGDGGGGEGIIINLGMYIYF